MSQVDLEKIRDNLRAGNNEVLAVFFKEHEQYCTLKLKKNTNCSAEDSEDIFMESILNLREKIVLNQLKELTNVRSYLYSTCFKKVLKRAEKNKKTRSQTTDIANYFYDHYDGYRLGEAEEGYIEEKKEVVYKAMTKLSEKCQDLLHFYYVERMRMKEIAEVLGYSNADVTKASKQRCFKSLLKVVRGH